VTLLAKSLIIAGSVNLNPLEINLFLVRAGLPVPENLSLIQKIEILTRFGLKTSGISNVLNVPLVKIYNERRRYDEDDVSMP
jgi:hypothetical protein